jgi:hypothetical protein
MLNEKRKWKHFQWEARAKEEVNPEVILTFTDLATVLGKPFLYARNSPIPPITNLL